MERIGRYQIIREIGRGAMSIVYEAFDNRIDRHLAIKVLRQGLAREVDSRQRFLREARAAGRLSHPNIVTVFDVGQVDGLPYLVMELLPGMTLDDQLTNGTALPVTTVVEIAVQLCGALDYAHRQGVVHCDIKPANIHYDHESGLIKLMDFGIAAIEGRGRGSDDEFHILGTPHYMAPEQVNGEPASERSDMYALGIVLYQLLSGHLPFGGETVAEVINAINHRKMRPLKTADPSTPKALVSLVKRLTSFEPAHRPGNTTQIISELRDIRAGMSQGILKNVRQHSFLWWRTALVALTMMVILSLGLSYVYQSQTEAIKNTAYGYGDSLASIIAQEAAEPLILDDTIALNLIVSDFSVNSVVEFLHITDADGTIIASTDPFMRGVVKTIDTGVAVSRESESIQLSESESGELTFQVPARFQSQRVGEIYLGMDGESLRYAANATLSMLGMLFLITALTVLFGLNWLTRRQQKAAAQLGWALKLLGSGQADIRIETVRRDEFAYVHKQFNRLAIRLDERAMALRNDELDARMVDTDSIVASGFFNADETVDLSYVEKTDETAEENLNAENLSTETVVNEVSDDMTAKDEEPFDSNVHALDVRQ